MVFIPVILAALAASAHASPISPSEILIERRSPSSIGEPSYITTCKKLVNCETYEDANGTPRIRFKEGMGPGSDFFEQHLNKRDDATTTEISISDNSVDWGCNTNPSDVMAQIQTLCPPGNGVCGDGASTTIQNPIQIVTSQGAVIQDDTLILTPTGAYPIWLEAGITAAVQSLAGVNVSYTDMHFLSSMPGVRGAPQLETTHPISSQCKDARQTSSIAVVRLVNNAMQGTLHVTIASQNAQNAQQSGFCNTFWKGLAEEAGSLFGALPGAGPAIAGVLGAVSGSCDT